MKRYGMVLNAKTCLGCQACVAACTQQHDTPFWSGNYRTHVENVVIGEFPDVSREFVPRLCMHCEDAPCVSVCPTGASHYIEGGIVVVDQETCMGCKACMLACPYDARYVYDAGDISRARIVYGPDVQQTSAHVDKCDFCYERLEEGLEPACVATCPGEARIFGDLNDQASRVAQLVSSGEAVPLAPELGTKPKVFYIR